ncbi:MAG: rRNA maturation RNase YbeY [Bacteroidia bacterium]|nr:rRNA maturation RNase YbeY [Bacteroidia bacterium]
MITFGYDPSLRPWRVRKAHQHKKWLLACKEALAPSQKRPFVLFYHFIPIERMCALHHQFLGEADPTDILTFSYPTDPTAPMEEVEIYIAPSQVREQAAFYGVSFAEELRRVMAHGLLHWLGWDDRDNASLTAMREAEEFCLRLWQTSCFT